LQNLRAALKGARPYLQSLQSEIKQEEKLNIPTTFYDVVCSLH